ncbi:MAG: response regulator [Desulfuromonadales bacterium]|nr:response regulator [Desulfuromonadales bacterium]
MATILVVDDDPRITAQLDRLLTKVGHMVMTAPDGKVALRLLDAFIFDVVITDIVMPEMDGFELIMNLKTRTPRPKIIAMTSRTDSLGHNYFSDIAKCMSVSRVLRKPFSAEEILEAVAGSDKPVLPTLPVTVRNALLDFTDIPYLNAA